MGLVSSWASTSAASNPSPCSICRSFVSGCCAGITMSLANHAPLTVRQNTPPRAGPSLLPSSSFRVEQHLRRRLLAMVLFGTIDAYLLGVRWERRWLDLIRQKSTAAEQP